MKNISIPEPCSENWNEMTPTEKGAFCQKCALEVIDFTNKSSDEIRQVLAQNIGNHACMRIKNTQMDELNEDFSAWRINNQQSFNRAWVFTLLVVFGMTLFSCQEEEEPVIKQYQKVAQTILDNEGDVIENQVVDSTEVSEVSSIKQNLPVQQEKQASKELIIQEKVLEECIVHEEVIVTGTVLMERDVYHTAGVPMITRDYDDYLFEVTRDSLEFPMGEAEKITGLVYPNPASNQTTLKIDMPKRGKGQIELFALSGQKIATIFEGRIKKGESEYEIDLSGMEPGLYLINVISGDLKETIKFSKI